MTERGAPFGADWIERVATVILGPERADSATLQRVQQALTRVHAYPLAAETEPALMPAPFDGPKLTRGGAA